MSVRGLTGRRAGPRLNARAMDRQVTIQAVTTTPDGGGGYTESVVSVATVWSKVEGLEGREQIEAMQTGMERPYRFTMRYRDDLTGANTILYDDRTFDVKSIVDTEERHRELVILADEVV